MIAFSLAVLATCGSAQPAFEAGEIVVGPRNYTMTNVDPKSFKGFLDHEAFTTDRDALFLDCAEVGKGGRLSEVCAADAFYQSRAFEQLVFAVVERQDAPAIFILIDDPVQPSVRMKLDTATMPRMGHITITVSPVADQRNTDWAARFVDEIDLRTEDNYLTLRHYTQYGELDRGHGDSHYVAEIRNRETYVFGGCHTCPPFAAFEEPSEDNR